MLGAGYHIAEHMLVRCESVGPFMRNIARSSPCASIHPRLYFTSFLTSSSSSSSYSCRIHSDEAFQLGLARHVSGRDPRFVSSPFSTDGRLFVFLVGKFFRHYVFCFFPSRNFEVMKESRTSVAD